MHLTSFPPILPPTPTHLILGSMPGRRSLELQQYYAFPQNAFWFIMGNLFEAGWDIDYPQRISHLKANQIAVWDVLKHCERKGSLDAQIDTDTEIANDLVPLFKQYPTLKKVCFNGRKSEQTFRKYIIPQLSADMLNQLTLIALPSTSPAYAAMPLDAKTAVWKTALLS